MSSGTLWAAQRIHFMVLYILAPTQLLTNLLNLQVQNLRAKFIHTFGTEV